MRIKQIKQKQSDNSFSEPIDIGADSENIDAYYQDDVYSLQDLLDMLFENAGALNWNEGI